jgi:predicted Zn-dependent protease with MMP-like domain
MHNDEQIYSEEEYDYNREPPLDKTTLSMNRSRSKYVLTTFCFLLALVLLYVHFNGMFADDSSSSWFPLLAAIVLAILGVVFLRSPDNAPEQQTPDPVASVIESKAGESMEEKPLSPFEELIREALSSIPTAFHEQMENIIVRAAYEPDEEVLKRVGVKTGYTLLGLYEGVPLTTYGRAHAPYPEIITIYQRPIEEYCQHDVERIRAQVRATVLHEIAHHFGMGHEEMPIWIK